MSPLGSPSVLTRAQESLLRWLDESDMPIAGPVSPPLSGTNTCDAVDLSSAILS